MGTGASTVDKNTSKLWSLITSNEPHYNFLGRAQQLIDEGVDIKKPNKNGLYMNQVVEDQENTCRLAGMIEKANNYKQLSVSLKYKASDLFVEALKNNDIGEMRVLFKYFHADCYQGNQLNGSLGLLGRAVQKENVTMEIITFLIENSPENRSAITQKDAQGNTIFTIHKCQKSIINYLKDTFNKELNKLPFKSNVDWQLAIQWIHQDADPEWVDDKGNTVLCNAVLADNFELVKALTAAQCNIQHENQSKQNPLSIAKNANKENPQLIAFLENEVINRKLQVLIKERKSALTQEEVQELLQQGADIKALGKNNDSILHILVANDGTPEMIGIFVNVFGVDIEMMNWHGYRPIEMCIMQGNVEQIQAIFKLVKVGTEHFFNLKLQKSLLDFAKSQTRSSNEVIKVIQDELNLRLWKCISSANKQETKNQPIITEAQRLCELGAQINHPHKVSEDESAELTVLHLVCKIGNLQLVRFLIETLKANNDGPQSISIAAEYGHLDIVKYLRSSGSKINVVSNQETQDTPLHLAAKNKHLLVTRYLVLWGANHEAKNTADQTPLDLAKLKKSNMTKGDEVDNKQLITFLEQLTCPDINQEQQTRPKSSRIVNSDIDVCEIPIKHVNDTIPEHDVQDEDPRGNTSTNLLTGTPNDRLRKAAKSGNLALAKQAIVDGADIRHREGNAKHSCYDVANLSVNEHSQKIYTTFGDEQRRQAAMLQDCKQIVNFLQNVAQSKLVQAIQEGQFTRVVSYHRVGAQLTPDLLQLACKSSNNVQIVNYLVQNSKENFDAMFNYSNDQESPFSLATKLKYSTVASYLKWRLSDELTIAVNKNDLTRVRQMVSAGASVDSLQQQNLLKAVQHNNMDMVKFLTEMGARIPDECLQQSRTSPEIIKLLTQYQLARKLRLAAATGNFQEVVKYQHEGVDINSKNCYGSTALSMTIENGNYFQIVHALVSRGASILHSNPKLPTLPQLAKKQNYKQIYEYLVDQINAQFLIVITNNDLESAQQLSQMGLNFNYQDEHNRTALHYAVQYHGLDIVKWLCESGANWKIADTNGQYPITEAAEKGDLPVVKYFIENYPLTKELKNKAGHNVLAIAKAFRYNRMVQLLDPGNKDFPVKEGEEDSIITPPKYTLKELLRASENGQVQIIKEFVDERYGSLATKTGHCRQMIEVAEQKNQQEVLAHLRPCYKLLTSEVNPENYLTVTAQQKRILEGFLGYLSGIIAGVDIQLDPSDPKTYHQLFGNLHSTAVQRIEQLNAVRDERDIMHIYEEDMHQVQQKLDNIGNKVNQMKQEEIKMMQKLEDAEEKLKKTKTAIERRDVSKEVQEMKEQLTVLNSEVLLFKAARVTAEKKKEILLLIRNDPGLVHFYNTVEHRLQSLFNGVYAAQSGLITREPGSLERNVGMVMDLPIFSVVPIADSIMSVLKGVVNEIVSIMDRTKQNKEYRNISTLGSIEYLQKAATNAAGLLTLYYKEQIDMVDLKRNVEGKHLLATFFNWLNKIQEGKPNENAVVYVAEFVVAWIIDSLKEGERKDGNKKEKIKNFVPYEPLADQLWLCVAKQSPMSTERVDFFDYSTETHKVPLKNGKSVALKRLFGYPQVISQGIVYQYSIEGDGSTENDFFQYGYIYLDPFTNEKTRELIIKQRKLKQVHVEQAKSPPDILGNVCLFLEGGGSTMPIFDDTNIKQTALSLAHSMKQQNLFVDPGQLKQTIDETRSDIVHKITLEYDVLRNEYNGKANHFQISIDAAYEKIDKDFQKCQDNLSEQQKVEYKAASKKLIDQVKQSQQQLEEIIKRQTKDMEKWLQDKCEEQNIIVKKAEDYSNSALDQAIKAQKSSMLSEQSAKESATKSQQLVESTEQRKQEMQTAIDESVKRLETTIAEQKATYEKSLRELQENSRLEMERMKEQIEVLKLAVTEAAKAAKQSASDANTTRKDADEQIKILKEENKKILQEAKETRQASEKAVKEAREADSHAKNAEEHAKKLQQKVEQMSQK